jgi:hypothetical protein
MADALALVSATGTRRRINRGNRRFASAESADVTGEYNHHAAKAPSGCGVQGLSGR